MTASSNIKIGTGLQIQVALANPSFGLYKFLQISLSHLSKPKFKSLCHFLLGAQKVG